MIVTGSIITTSISITIIHSFRGGGGGRGAGGGGGGFVYSFLPQDILHHLGMNMLRTFQTMLSKSQQYYSHVFYILDSIYSFLCVYNLHTYIHACMHAHTLIH